MNVCFWFGVLMVWMSAWNAGIFIGHHAEGHWMNLITGVLFLPWGVSLIVRFRR